MPSQPLEVRPLRARKEALSRAAIAVLPLLAARVAFRAVQDGVLGFGASRLLARHVARHFLEGLAHSLIPAIVLAGLAAEATRRRWGRAAVGAILLVAAALAFGFVSFHLPPSAYYAIEAETARGRMGLGIAGIVATGAALVLWPRLRPPFQRAAGWLTPLVAVASLGVLLLWPAGSDRERPNLILISLDTLRRDHVGSYGYERDTTPALDAFTTRSLRFDEAFSVMPWTLTAHMSMLTGLYPAVHGLDKETGLPVGIPTLSDQLGAAGYLTLGVVDEVAFVGPQFGYARGFDLYEQVVDDATTKVDRVLGLLDDVGDDRFFLFTHFFDPHSDFRELPYEAAPEDLSLMADWYVGDDAAWCSPEGDCASKLLLAMFEADEQMAGERLERLIDLYDAGVRSLDRELGRLFDELERRGRLEDTVILITADHGEEFFDHGKPLHGRCYDECVAVPFVLYTPPALTAGAGTLERASDQVVSLVDVLPTFLDFAGLEPAAAQQGLSLAPLVRGEPLARERDAVVIEQIDGFRGLRGARWSLVPFGKRLLLFDTDADPGQLTELRGRDYAPVRRGLREKLEAENRAADILRENLGADALDVSMSEEDQAVLENLGYAGD